MLSFQSCCGERTCQPGLYFHCIRLDRDSPEYLAFGEGSWQRLEDKVQRL